MFQFFDTIAGFFELIGQYLLTIIESLISFITLIPHAVSIPLSIVGFMPALIGTSILAVIGVSIIKLIIGR